MTTDTGRAAPPPEPARPRVPRRPGRRLLRAVMVIAPAALAASFALMLREHPPVLIDLQVYRWAVATWLDGGDILGEAPVTSVGIALPWVYPPFALLPLSTVSLVPFPVGAGILYALDVLALGGTLYLVARHLWPHAGTRAAVAVAAGLLPFTLFLEPVYASFGLGQVNIVLMGLVVADCLAERPRWPRGLLIGIAAAIKLTPAVFVLFLLLRRDVRAAVVAVATAAVATGIGFLVDTTASLDYWFGQGPAAGVSASAYRTNQSVAGGLARLDLAPQLTTALWVLLALVLLALVAHRVRRVDAAPGVAATGLLALLVSPTSWSDHWVWVVPGLLLMIGYALRLRSARWWLLAALTAATAVAAPFDVFIGPDEQSMAWPAWQHLVGDAYLILGVGLLVLFGLFGPRADAPASSPRPEARTRRPAAR